jgi:aspartyl-tRNA(Asn)/glutamyl-tRNA(Gln) amidotransferase subunit A
VVLDGMDSTVAAAWQRALSLLYAAGVQITEAVVPPFASLRRSMPRAASRPPRPGPGTASHIAARLAEYDPRVGTRILRGKDISAADYIELLARRQQWIAAVQAQMADHDLMLMPTVPVIAPKIADSGQRRSLFRANGLMLRNPTLINFLDGCAVSCPATARARRPWA